jgi:hypothetical protein
MITELKHPTFQSNRRTWLLIRRMLTGDGASKELNKRYFESTELFRERKRDADFTPYTRHMLSRLVGMLFQREDEVTRDAPADDLDSVGPSGEDYVVQLMTLAETLLAYDEAYVVLDPGEGLHVLSPLSVPVWDDTDVVVDSTQSTVDLDAGIATSYEVSSRYRPGSVEVYRQFEVGGETTEKMVGQSDYWPTRDAFFVDTAGRPSAPVVHVEMPWSASFGELVARKHRSIYEMTSRRDFAASVSMNGLLQVGVGGDDELAQKIRDKIMSGAQTLPYHKDYGEHGGVVFPTDGAEHGTKILSQKLQELKRIAHNELEEATRKSATEAQIQHSGGAAAALSVLAQTIEDAETAILPLVSQMQDYRFAGPAASSFSVSASWPKDYSDIVSSQHLIDKVFPAQIPLPAEDAAEVVVEYLQANGHDPDPQAIEERIQTQIDADAQAASASSFDV